MKNRQITLTATALLGLALLPCTVKAYDQQDQVRHYSVHHAGVARHYCLFVPTGYSPGTPMPLVLSIHGRGWTDMGQMMMCGMNVVAEREGFLVAYPDAISGNWYGINKTDPYDDIGYMESLVDQVSTFYTVDASRVYAAGYSEGAVGCYILSVELPYKFAAIAPVAAVRPYIPGTDILFPAGVPMVPSRPFPVLHIHGTADAWVPYEGGISPVDGWQWLGCEQVVAAYAGISGCDSTPTLTDLPDLDLTDGTTVQLLTYNNCGTYVDTTGKVRPAEALLYRVVGGGHNWPSDANWVRSGEGPVTHDIVASELIWAFFSRHVVAAP